MSLSRIKVWIAGEVLTASDLNTEFNNILQNPVSLISPLTGALDLDGNSVTLDAAGATSFVSSAAVSWNFTSGSKTGTPGTTGSISNWSAQTFTDSNTAGSGTAAAWVGHAFQRPTLAATNALVTTTAAATVYIPNSPLAGTNQTLTNAYALWVDDGAVRLDGALGVAGVATLSGGVNGVVLTATAMNEAKGSDVASATPDIGAATGNMIDVTGTTTIAALGTVQAGARRVVRFTGALTLTYNATSLILPTSANITTVANDRAEFISLGSGNWLCTWYQRADGTAVAGGLASQGSSLVLLATSVASASNYFQFDNLFTSTYDEYQVHITGTLPTTDGSIFKAQVGTGGGPTYDTGSNYNDSGHAYSSGSFSGFAGNRAYVSISGERNVDGATTKPMQGIVTLYSPASTAFHKMFQYNMTQTNNDTGAIERVTGDANYASTTAVTGLRCFFGTAGTNTIAEGTALLFGVKKA